MKYSSTLQHIIGGRCGLSHNSSTHSYFKPDNDSIASKRFSIIITDDTPYAFSWSDQSYTLTRDPADRACQLMDIPFAYAEITESNVIDWTKSPHKNYGATEYILFC